jgi:hypothetical protein
MAMSDEDLVRQLESVPQVEAPDMKNAILARLHAPHPAFNRRRVLIGLAWAAAIVIVIGVVFQRQSLPWQHTAATLAPLPVEKWPVVARVAVPEEGRLTIRRSGDQFAIQPFASTSEAISVAWDQKKLQLADVVSDPEVVILQRKNGAFGSAVIQLNVGGREVLRTAISLD